VTRRDRRGARSTPAALAATPAVQKIAPAAAAAPVALTVASEPASTSASTSVPAGRSGPAYRPTAPGPVPTPTPGPEAGPGPGPGQPARGAGRLEIVGCVGVPITVGTMEDAADHIVEVAVGGLDHGVDVHQCSAHTLAEADRNDALHALLCRASINFADGMGVVWASRFGARGRRRRRLGPSAGPVRSERVHGAGLMLEVFARGRAVGLRHYLLGSTPVVLERMRAELAGRFGPDAVVGMESPPFRALTALEEREQASRIQASGAHVVWVGLGAPKQDWAVARLAAAVPVVAVAVGAAFDFVAGTKPVAPGWMSRHGLEWLFRLCSEPRRLWRRYLFGNARFVYAALRRRAECP